MMQAGVALFEASGYLGMTRETLETVYAHHHPDHQSGAVGAFDHPRINPDRNMRTDSDSSSPIVTKVSGFAR